MTCSAVDRGPTGFCGNGRHALCPYSPGNACEGGIWVPETYVTLPPRAGHRHTSPFRQGFTDAVNATLDGQPLMVIRPSHMYRCTCDCHSTLNSELIVGQLELFEVA